MADAATAKVHIVNRALIKLGMPPSYSIDGESNLGGTVDAVWPGVAARSVATYDWSHSRRTYKPVKLATAPDNGWEFGFVLPAERIGEPIAVLSQAGLYERYLRDYMVEAGNIYARIDPIWVRVRVLLSPDFWDQGFAAAFTLALAAAFAVPLLQDEDLAAELDAQAFGRPQDMGSGGLFGRLIALDRAAQPQGRGFMANDPLTSARWS